MRMKWFIIGSIVGAILTVLALATLGAEPTANLDLTANSQYIWRGQMVDDKPVIQPELTLGWAGLEAGAFGNYSTDANEYNETDLSLSYTYGILTAGVVTYLYDPDDGNTSEAFLTLAPDWTVAPYATIYRDIDLVDGWYGELGVGVTRDLACDMNLCDLSLEVKAWLGAGDSKYNEAYWGVDDDLLNDANVSLALPWAPKEWLTVTPAVQYMWLVDSDLANTVEDEDAWVGSLTVGFGI